MNDDFKTLVDRRLSRLEWKGDDQVMKRIQSQDEKSTRSTRALIRPALALCLLLVLLSATALAVGLGFSQRYSIQRQARNALHERYGLTDEMLDLFNSYTEQDGDAWTVSFTEASMNAAAIGEYTVTKKAGGSPAAAWSHDGTDPTVYAGDSLTASVWGPGQLQNALQLRKDYEAQSAELESLNTSDWTLEQWAAYDAALGPELQNALGATHILPTEDDITPEEAIALGRKAVQEKFGFSEQELAAYEPKYLSFLYYAQDGERQYFFTLASEANGKWKDSFSIRVPSPAGEVICGWLATEESRLPAGDLSAYPEAVKVYVREGLFAGLSAQEKVEVGARVEAAGLGGLLPETGYAAPQDGEFPEADVPAAARAALARDYGFTDAGLTFFELHVSLLEQEGQRIYQCAFSPRLEEITWALDRESLLGAYTVTLLAATGEPLSSGWTLDGQVDDAGYTEETFGQSDVYSARMLSWLRGLLDAGNAILEKYPEEDRYPEWMSLEDAAAYDQLFRDAGFDPQRFSHVLPEDSDIDEARARAVARQALKDERGLSDAWIDACEVTVELCESASYGGKAWGFTYHSTEGDVAAVILSAETGEIQAVYYYPVAYANG